MTEWRLQDVADRYPHGALEVSVRDEAGLREVLWGFAAKEPRVVTVGVWDCDALQIGIGGEWGFVQHVVCEPWKAQIAIPRKDRTEGQKPESVTFLLGGAVSEIEAEFLMPVAEVIQLVLECYREGKLPPSVEWELW